MFLDYFFQNTGLFCWEKNITRTKTPSYKLQPHVRRGKFIFDAASKLWYNPNSKLFFNEKTKQYSKEPGGPFYVYNESTKKLQLITS